MIVNGENPSADRFIGNVDASFSQQFSDIARAELEASVRPDPPGERRSWDMKTTMADQRHLIMLAKNDAEFVTKHFNPLDHGGIRYL